MQKTLKLLRIVLSAATVGIVLLLCWHCLNIYLVGNSPENIQAGVYLSPVYSAKNVSERLANISPVLLIYILFAFTTAVMHLVWGMPQHITGKIRPCPPREFPVRNVAIARIILFCLGVLFIVLGTMNGGARDVLIKAINICTECIGLG